MFFKQETSALLEEIKKLFIYNSDTGVITRIKDNQNITSYDRFGYIRVNFSIGHKRIRIQGHRVAYAMFYGRWPKNILDHRDGIASNNKIKNIRDSAHALNAKNKQKLNINNRTGVTGVYWNTERKKWQAQIRVDNKVIPLGRYDTLEDASRIRQIATEKYHLSVLEA